MLDVADRLAISELISDYGHLVDDRDSDRVGSVDYRDEVRRGASEWRIAPRAATLRRRET